MRSDGISGIFLKDGRRRCGFHESRYVTGSLLRGYFHVRLAWTFFGERSHVMSRPMHIGQPVLNVRVYLPYHPIAGIRQSCVFRQTFMPVGGAV